MIHEAQIRNADAEALGLDPQGIEGSRDRHERSTEIGRGGQALGSEPNLVLAMGVPSGLSPREKHLKRCREYYIRNRERIRAQQRQHYAENRVAILAQQKLSRLNQSPEADARDAERKRKWKQAHPIRTAISYAKTRRKRQRSDLRWPIGARVETLHNDRWKVGTIVGRINRVRLLVLLDGRTRPIERTCGREPNLILLRAVAA